MTDRALILSLAERLWIVSTLLTAAANRLPWDAAAVQELMDRLRKSLEESP